MRIGDPKKFTLTEEHVKLLRRAGTWWDDAYMGAPGIYPKKPFGNSDIVGDVVDILEWHDMLPEDEDDDYSDELFERVEKIMRELEQALQVLLRCGTVEPGDYETDGAYDDDWSKVE